MEVQVVVVAPGERAAVQRQQQHRHFHRHHWRHRLLDWHPGRYEPHFLQLRRQPRLRRRVQQHYRCFQRCRQLRLNARLEARSYATPRG